MSVGNAIIKSFPARSLPRLATEQPLPGQLPLRSRCQLRQFASSRAAQPSAEQSASVAPAAAALRAPWPAGGSGSGQVAGGRLGVAPVRSRGQQVATHRDRSPRSRSAPRGQRRPGWRNGARVRLRRRRSDYDRPGGRRAAPRSRPGDRCGAQLARRRHNWRTGSGCVPV